MNEADDKPKPRLISLAEAFELYGFRVVPLYSVAA
jgi:hypothetical protein